MMRRWRLILAGLAAGALLLLGTAAWLDARYPPVLDRYQQRSTLVVDAGGAVLRAFAADDGYWRLRTDVDDVAPLYLDMLVAYEDHRFRSHPGVDPLALGRALLQWARNGRVVSGGSTLTMQVARLLEPRPRTIGAKLIEMARALQLERRHSKDELLGMYLTLAPFGGNMEGVRAAALAYFGKEPDALTTGEAALLVALPQAPTRTRPDRHADAARTARDKVLARLVATGVLSPVEGAEAMQQAVPSWRHAMPFHAPHLAAALARQSDAERVPSFIDGNLQAELEQLAGRTLTGLHPQANLAVLVVDHRARTVIAHIGSADFFAEARAGQMDLTRAVRSPGSALKPFIYGMGFEDLTIHPETIIADRERRFGDYAPVNFDPVFVGDVTIREALTRSLNLPAVAVLDRVGPRRLAARLRAVGAPLILADPEEPPRLPIALGGAGTTLFDLVTLYSALPRLGLAAPPRLSPAQPAPETTPLLEAAAAWQVSRILAGVPPPGNLVDPRYARTAPRIAYKTGTSYGFRDAWAIGYDSDHTVGVWVGRPDGSPSPDRYGRNTAAPVLFAVFDLLPEPSGDLLGEPPPGVLDVANIALPPRLRRFEDRPATTAAMSVSGAPALAIDFPLDSSTVDLSLGDGTLDSLPLIAQHGTRPLRWLVNGRPIASSALRREAEWRPDSPGHAKITVIDADGATASAEVWLR